MRIPFPAKGRHSFHTERWDTIWDNLESVGLVLDVEDLEARDGNNTCDDVVLLLEVVGGVDANADLRSGTDDGDVGVGGLEDGVTTLERRLDGGVLKLRKVLTGQSEDAWGGVRGERRVVSGTGLIAVGRAPNHEVGESTEVSQGLNGLMGRSVLTQTDGVVGSNVDGADVGESREANGASGVGNEVEESASSWDDGTVGSHTVHDTGHGVFTDTVTDVTAGPVTDSKARRLEVDSILPPSVVGSSQIRRAGEKLRDNAVDLLEDSLGKLTRRNCRVAGGVGWQGLLPSLGKLASETTGKVSVLLGVFRSVLLEEVVPLLLLGGTLSGVLVVEVIDLLGNDEGLLGVEAKERLDALAVVGLQGVSVDTAGALELGTETNGSGDLDHGWLVPDRLGPLNSSLDASQVIVTVLDPLSVPAVGFESLGNILGESDLGVTIYEQSATDPEQCLLENPYR